MGGERVLTAQKAVTRHINERLTQGRASVLPTSWCLGTGRLVEHATQQTTLSVGPARPKVPVAFIEPICEFRGVWNS